MKRRRFGLWAPLAVIVCAGLQPGLAQAAQPVLKYKVTPERIDGALTDLRVRVDIAGAAGRELTLDVPDALRAHLAPSDFSIEGGQWLAGTQGKALRVRMTKKHLSITYGLLSDGHTRLTADDQGMGIHVNGFAFRGEDALLIPEGEGRARAEVDVVPVEGWLVTTSLAGPEPLETVEDSLLLGGADYRMVRRTVEGVPFRMAYPKSMAERANAVFDDAATLITVERRFWGTPARPVFIGLVQLSDAGDMSGRGMSGGFSLYLGQSASEKAVRRLIAHENLHNWISRAIGGFPATDSDLEAWLNEGFTEAYTARLLLSSGLWTPQDYVDDWNDALVRYGTSPVKSAPNSRILADRQRDFDVNRLPYDRGRILAVVWDKAFRDHTQGRIGLADVLRAQIKVAARNTRSGRAISADRLFPVVARRVAGVDLGHDLDAYVDKGEDLVIDKDLFGPCLTVETVTQPVFDRGFDLDATFRAHGKVTGLEPGGPAERAGLKAGDKVRIDEIPTHDSRVTLSYRVDDGNGRGHVVIYHPEGRAMVSFQQLKPAITDLEACASHWP